MNILVLEGDVIGPEITLGAMCVLNTASKNLSLAKLSQ